MKRISFLLSLLMVFSLLVTACSDVGEDSDVSGISETSSTSNVSENQNDFTDIDVNKGPFKTVVSNGAAYTTTINADSNYPDTYSTELTDGIRSSSEIVNYTDESLSGYLAKEKSLEVVVDLGFECDKLYGFKVGYLATSTAGISAPTIIKVQVSLDNSEWKDVGELEKPIYIENAVQEASLFVDECVSARYVRFYLEGSAAWLFLDEVIVIANVDSTEQEVQYLDAVNSAYQQLGTVVRPDSGNDINRELSKVLISKGAKYTTDGEQIENFKDNGKKLTDGNLSGYYQGETWVGFEGGRDVTVTIDLGKTVDDIAAVEASFFANTSVKLYMPVAIKVCAISADDERTELGILYGSAMLSNGNYKYSLPLAKTVSARYIEFTMVSTESKMYLVEEFAVYAYREYEYDSLYPPVKLTNDSTDWGSDATDEYTNLIAGKTQQIVAMNQPEKDFYKNNTPVTSGLLTDGKKSADIDIHNGKFFKFNQGRGRIIVYDLEHISAVDKFAIRFTHIPSWGVVAPTNVQIGVSIDGIDWYEVGNANRPSTDNDGVYQCVLQLSNKVKARYVLFSFNMSSSWVGCDEIEVYGTKSISGASEFTVYPEKNLLSGGRIAPSEDILGGSKDVCLLYIGDEQRYTVDDLMPYLAYLDENGEIKDTMFDSFLFLFNGQFPSGGYSYKEGKLSGWEWSLNDVFADGRNLKALEVGAGRVKEALGLDDDFKYKVSLSLYYPTPLLAGFGDIDGDGTIDSLDTLEKRIKAVNKYIDMLEQAFNEQDFKNIELVGYYWFHETIESADGESVQLLNAISDYVHTKGKDFFWIPYFRSNGYDKWAEYGFDCAVMQPNYVFNLDTPYSNVVNCAQLTAMYGMGVEMEICSQALWDINYFKKYMQYIAGGVEFGYMDDCIVMYYQTVFDFRDACNSGTIMGRMVYDSTYHFIKGDLKYKPDAIENIYATVDKNTPYNGSIKIDNDKLCQLEIYTAPKHGSVSLNNDGTFVFYPEKDYSGDVTFSFVYSEYLGWSDPCEVTITVK